MPPAATSAGAEAVKLAAASGLVLDPWQVFALEMMLVEDELGRWAAFEFGLLVARQNGKGGILEARVLAGLFLFGEQLIIWTAHEFKTAKEAYLRLKALIERNPALLARVKHRGSRVVGFRQSNEDTSIELESGQRVRFLARNKSAGRGFTGDVVIFDEAQELPTTTIEATMPTTSARPNPQIIYTGTAPEDTNDATHFESVRDRGRAGGDPELAWLEWSLDPDVVERLSPEELEVLLASPSTWAECNPALGYRITRKACEREHRSMTRAGFCRERLSLWRGRKGKAAIDVDLFGRLGDGESMIVGPMALALDMPPDRSTCSVAIAGRRADGRWHGELVDYRPGSSWVAGRVSELVGRWGAMPVALDASGPVGSLVPELEAVGVEPWLIGMGDMGRACGRLFDAITDDGFRHLEQAPLTVAVSGATWRPLGDSRAWARRGSVDISPLVAVTEAVYAVDAAPRPREGGNVW